MFDQPDWLRRLQSKDAWGNPFAGNPMPPPAAALSPGLNTAAPMNTSQLPGGNYNDVDNAPYDPTQGANNSSQAMRGAPVPPPAYMPQSAPQNPPLPPHRPGGNWDTTAALEGDPAGQPDWATPQAQAAAADENGRQVGPGSWLDPAKLGRMVDPNSLVGRMMAMRNPSPAPQAQQHQGLLAPLFKDGGLFGRDPTSPNSTIGGLW